MTCPHCGAANADGARFCGGCGQAMSATHPAPELRTSEPPSLIGREIAGRFRILAKIGEGGMGAVYRAEQISLKRTVALKLLRPEVAASPQLVRRFNAEAEAVAKLNHPNTVGIYDFGQDTDGTLFISMEFIEGRSLRSVVHTEAPLHLARALGIASQIAASLIDAHAHGLVHRDLKPDNVMLQDRGRQRDVARVLDFGIAKLRDDSRQSQMAMTQAGDMLGTPQYMSPEQIKGEAIDGRTDIYALGCILYEMTTARLPFEAQTVMALLSKHLLENPVPPSQRRPDLGLPPFIDDLVMSALGKQPIARPQTMEQYAERIAAVAAMVPPDPNAVPLSGARHQALATPAAPMAAVPHVPTPGYAQPPAHVPTPGYNPYAGAPPPQQQPPQPYSPYAHAPPHAGPPPVAPAPARSGGGSMLWIILAIVLIAGGGTLAYVVSRNHAAAASSSGGSTPSTPEVPTPPPSQNDPWAGGATGSAGGVAVAPVVPVVPPPVTPDAADVLAEGSDPDFAGSDEPDEADPDDYLKALALPPGVKLVAPAGFEVQVANGMQVMSNADSTVMITASGSPGVGDMTSSMPGSFKVKCHGKLRSGYKQSTKTGGITMTTAMFVFAGKGYEITVMGIMRDDDPSPEDMAAVLDKVLVLPDDPS